MRYNLYNRSSDFLIALAEGLSKIATFVIIPVSGLFLATKDFNLWSIIFPSIQILSAALSFGLPNYILRSYFLPNTEKKVDNNPVFVSFLLLTLLSVFLFVIFKLVFPNNEFIRWDIYLILVSNSFLVLIQQKYQAEKNGVKFFNQSLVWRIGFALILVVFFLFKWHVSIDFLLASLLVIQLLLLSVAIYQECIPFKLNFDLKLQGEIFKFGFPLFLMGMMQFIIYMNSRYFVYHKGEASQTAVFSLIHTFAGTLNLLFVIFVRIYIPKLFEVLSEKTEISSLFFYKKTMFTLMEIISLCMIIGLFIYSSLYKSKFEEYIFLITPILVIGQFFYGLQLFIVDSLTFFNKTINLFIVSLSSVFFSVIIGYFLVDKFGILGGAIGIALSQLLSLIIVIFFTADLFKAILGFRFCIERIIRISLFILVPFIFYQAFGKIASISVCLIIVSYLVWKLNIPSLSKEFV